MGSAAPPLVLPPSPPTHDPAVAQYLAQVSVALQNWATQVVATLGQSQTGTNIVTFTKDDFLHAITIVDGNGNGLFISGSGPIFTGTPQVTS